MYSDAGDTTSLVPGFPIRTSSDPRSVGSSPRHIAASHVLHRLSVPRHPPCALKHLQHKTKKNESSPTHHTHPQKGQTSCAGIRKICITTKTHNTQLCIFDARNHYPQIKHHTPPPKLGATTRPPPPNHKPPRVKAGTRTPNGARAAGLLSQSPIVCLMILSTGISLPAP